MAPLASSPRCLAVLLPAKPLTSAPPRVAAEAPPPPPTAAAEEVEEEEADAIAVRCGPWGGGVAAGRRFFGFVGIAPQNGAGLVASPTNARAKRERS